MYLQHIRVHKIVINRLIQKVNLENIGINGRTFILDTNQVKHTHIYNIPLHQILKKCMIYSIIIWQYFQYY